jgi:ribose transport system ATP-binding protein
VSVGAGEIVGVIGLIGSGVSTLLDIASGVRTSKQARVEVDGVEHTFTSRRDAQRLGIGAVPVDRKATGLVLETSVAKNIGLSSLKAFSSGGFTRTGKMREAARESQRVFDIRLSSVDQPVKSLSGGNQQKVMLGRWYVGGSTTLVIQEPTQGVDIGARQEIHRYLIDFAQSGGTVLFSSSDLEEVRTLAHRIYVMHAGEIVDEISNMGDVKPTRQALTQAMAAGNLGDAEREVWV